MKKYLAELIGTFALVFFGTGAIVIDQATGGSITHLGISLAFGLVVMCMIFLFGDISGAHFNPAVTFGFCVSKRLPIKEAAPYVLSQLIGATVASVLLHLMFPSNLQLGATLPNGSDAKSFLVETILAFFLMLVILEMSSKEKEKGLLAAIAIGSMVLLEALVAGPISGASMNPARSFAPAVVSGNLGHLWIYLTAPFIGAAIAVSANKILHSNHIPVSQ